MPIISRETLDSLNNSIDILESYYRDVRAFFEFVENRFKIPEYGCALQSIAKHEFFSNSSGFKLSDESSYPYYLWLPSWLGRFYVGSGTSDREGLSLQGQAETRLVMSFVWLWHGTGDAYVKDTNEPECWIGVTVPVPDTETETHAKVALTIFQQFRSERNRIEAEDTGWIEGRFHPNSIGCNLSGVWSLKRIPLRSLTTFYEIEQHVVKPLGERHYSMMTPILQDD